MNRKLGEVIFDQEGVQVVVFSIENEANGLDIISTNQYLIINSNRGFLIDPGGMVLAQDLADAVGHFIPIENLEYIFFSHQDPDVLSSIEFWSMATPAKLLVPSVWERFISHFAILDFARVVPIEDEGVSLQFGTSPLQFIPAHFLHSPGNLTVYEHHSKILFSGDIGAAIFPPDKQMQYTTDFHSFKEFAQGFHQRYMAGNRACRRWVSLVQDLEIAMIAPQHGAIYKEKAVKEFLEWFSNLECGVDLL